MYKEISIIIIIVIIIMGINRISSRKKGSIWNEIEKRKVKGYECGYELRGKEKEKIKIRHIIIGILYIIFDIEVVIIIPYSIISGEEWEYWIIMKILWILSIGYINEIREEII